MLNRMSKELAATKKITKEKHYKVLTIWQLMSEDNLFPQNGISNIKGLFRFKKQKPQGIFYATTNSVI